MADESNGAAPLDDGGSAKPEPRRHPLVVGRNPPERIFIDRVALSEGDHSRIAAIRVENGLEPLPPKPPGSERHEVFKRHSTAGGWSKAATFILTRLGLRH